MNATRIQVASILAAAALALGCSTSGPQPDGSCEDGKCDDPGSAADRECREECAGDSTCFEECRAGRAIQHCEARRGDALESSQKAFTKDAIRWACADVEGVNTNRSDDRGQEYCEYFPVVQLPPEVEGGEDLPPVVTPGLEQPLSLELNEEQIFQLEDNPNAVVGQCVFTSWHSDIDESLPVCEGGCPNLAMPEDAELPPWSSATELGVPLEARYMRMKGRINSNGAAADLFEKCLSGPPENEYPEADLDDHYMRGCLKTFELFTTEWRRSDPSVCVVGARLRECGCVVDANQNGEVDEEDIADIAEISRAVVPFQPDPEDGSLSLRGFHLGTWSDKNALPTGCRYIDTGDTGTRTLVSCDLTGSDLLSSASDLKGRCRDKYGDNVVAHVPGHLNIQDAIVCEPDPDAPHTADCGNMPWVVGNEGATPDPKPEQEPEPEPEPTTCDFDICTAHEDAAPAADCSACTEAVCADDSFCCESRWDSLCASKVSDLCADEYQCESAE